MTFADGGRVQPHAVIWATGFALAHSLVKAPVFDDAGRVQHRRGVTSAPGLYFLGLPWQHTRGAALLGWVEDDAAFIAERVAGFAGRRVPAGTAQAQRDGHARRPTRSRRSRSVARVEVRHASRGT